MAKSSIMQRFQVAFFLCVLLLKIFRVESNLKEVSVEPVKKRSSILQSVFKSEILPFSLVIDLTSKMLGCKAYASNYLSI